MYETSDIRKNLKIELDGDPYIVIDFQFVKPGKGNAFTRTKLRNMKTGAVIERTYRSGEKFTPAALEEKQMQYLYADGDQYCFMDTGTYEQVYLTKEQIGDGFGFLTENLVVDILFHSHEAIGVTLPNFVEIEVAESEPGVKGDTTSGASKPATLTTGIVIDVPLFVEAGDVLRIDTRTGEYVERVKLTRR
jgi:elongation factor P